MGTSTNSGNSNRRPTRPAQLSDMAADKLEGGLDPQQISEMSHTTAQSLLHRVHQSADPALVNKVLTLIETEGIDIIAELWSRSSPQTLPGILWRLYTLRAWMRKNDNLIAQLWPLGEPAEGAASAITGVEEFPTAQDITATADSILTGAFTGDFAVALDRASAFVDVISAGMATAAERLRQRYPITGPIDNPANHRQASSAGENPNPEQVSEGRKGRANSSSDTSRATVPTTLTTPTALTADSPQTCSVSESTDSAETRAHIVNARQAAHQAMELETSSASLARTATEFHVGAELWRKGQLE